MRRKCDRSSLTTSYKWFSHKIFIQNLWLDVDGDPAETECGVRATERKSMFAFTSEGKVINELHRTLCNILSSYSNKNCIWTVRLPSASWRNSPKCMHTCSADPWHLGALRSTGWGGGGWNERMDETHLFIFHSVSNRARGKRSSLLRLRTLSTHFFLFNYLTKIKHIWEQGGPWCSGALCSLHVLPIGRITSAYVALALHLHESSDPLPASWISKHSQCS